MSEHQTGGGAIHVMFRFRVMPHRAQAAPSNLDVSQTLLDPPLHGLRFEPILRFSETKGCLERWG